MALWKSGKSPPTGTGQGDRLLFLFFFFFSFLALSPGKQALSGGALALDLRIKVVYGWAAVQYTLPLSEVYRPGI